MSRREPLRVGVLLSGSGTSLENLFECIDRDGIRAVFREQTYPRPALTPPLAATPADPIDPPDVVRMGATVTISHRSSEVLRAWVVYRASDGAYLVDRIHPATVDALTMSPGDYVVTAADRFGRESQGRQFTID